MRFFSLGWKCLSPRLNRCFTSVKSGGGKVTHMEVGVYGEEVARDFVRSEGAKVLYKNYRGPKGGEVDIIVRDGDVLCFVEVKSRSKRSDFSRPMDAVDAKKRRYIIRGAKAWRRMLRVKQYLWRYDVIEVILEDGEKPDVNWVKQAFTEE